MGARRIVPVEMGVQIFRSALSFHEGAQRSFEQREGGDGQTSFPVVHAIVGLAFASELYLKALHTVATGKPRQGHRLNVLFAGLSVTKQQAIEARYDERRRGSGANFANDLVAFSNAFVEWRYVYETRPGALDVVGLAQLASALYETLVAADSGLQADAYTHARLTAPAQGFPIRTPRELDSS